MRTDEEVVEQINVLIANPDTTICSNAWWYSNITFF